MFYQRLEVIHHQLQSDDLPLCLENWLLTGHGWCLLQIAGHESPKDLIIQSYYCFPLLKNLKVNYKTQ